VDDIVAQLYKAASGPLNEKILYESHAARIASSTTSPSLVMR
jgi:hypothetical protein